MCFFYTILKKKNANFFNSMNNVNLMIMCYFKSTKFQLIFLNNCLKKEIKNVLYGYYGRCNKIKNVFIWVLRQK
jgi:hypothetical protein